MKLYISNVSIQEFREIYQQWRGYLYVNRIIHSNKDVAGEVWLAYKKNLNGADSDELIRMDSCFEVVDRIPHSCILIERRIGTEDVYDVVAANWEFGKKLIEVVIKKPDKLDDFSSFDELTNGKTSSIAKINKRSGAVAKVYKTVKEAAKDGKATPAQIREVLDGTRRTAGGFTWRYEV